MSHREEFDLDDILQYQNQHQNEHGNETLAPISDISISDDVGGIWALSDTQDPFTSFNTWSPLLDDNAFSFSDSNAVLGPVQTGITEPEESELADTVGAPIATDSGFASIQEGAFAALKHIPMQSSRTQPSLPRRRSRYFMTRSHNGTPPMSIPNLRSPTETWSYSDPMQRWRHSPPEDEPASMSAIYDALQQHSLDPAPNDASAQGHSPFQAAPGQIHSLSRAASTTSIGSGTSASSLNSGGSSRSTASTRSKNRRTRAPRRPNRESRANKNKAGDSAGRIFACTFCCDKFKHKYDWTRHEKSKHLNTEEWRCAPHGGSVLSAVTGRVHCAYCNLLDPTAEHLDMHNHRGCLGDGDEQRSFRRKDHLVQHLRLMHSLEALPLIDDWKVDSAPVSSRCGFCDARMQSWDERSNHLAAHFRKGLTMRNWKGDHDFEPSIAAQVTNAIPPYMIAEESQTLLPFSATRTKDHYDQVTSQLVTTGIPDAPLESSDHPRTSISSSAFTERFTLYLGRYARHQMSLGIIPTDEMFQQEARRVVFECEDDWNQTCADNPEWLAAFRRQNGWD